MDDIPREIGLEENSIVERFKRLKKLSDDRRRREMQEYFKKRYGAANPDHPSELDEIEDTFIRRSPQGASELLNDRDVFSDLSKEELEVYYKESFRIKRSPQRRSLLDDLEAEVRESVEQTGILDEFATEW